MGDRLPEMPLFLRGDWHVQTATRPAMAAGGAASDGKELATVGQDSQGRDLGQSPARGLPGGALDDNTAIQRQNAQRLRHFG